MRAYFDWNATTPPRPEVLDAMRDASAKAWANPSSIHGDGRAARSVIEDARYAIADLVGLDARDLTFTSGGTEANNLALRSLTKPNSVLVTSRLEHPSVTRVAEALEREGRVAKVRWLAVKESGQIDLSDLDAALAEAKGNVSLVTIQAVNHETGIIQPVAETIRKAHDANALVHVDAIQGWGKIQVPRDWDTASIAPHKMRGPKGIGAIAVRQGSGARIDPVLLGGSQEKGVRPGTIDASLAAGFGVAARLAMTSPERWAKLAALRDRIEAALLALELRDDQQKQARAGDPTLRAPHVSNIMWPGWVGAELVAALDIEGLSCSSGAACSAGTVEPSPVLEAMFGAELATHGVRLSIGDLTTEADADVAIAAFRKVLLR